MKKIVAKLLVAFTFVAGINLATIKNADFNKNDTNVECSVVFYGGSHIDPDPE